MSEDSSQETWIVNTTKNTADRLSYLKFAIKNSYYMKSDPIRSALITVTGLTDVVQALKAFFAYFKQIFVFNEKNCELRLTVNTSYKYPAYVQLA